jgi:putative methyltransferase (TIGR04325 family)
MKKLISGFIPPIAVRFYRKAQAFFSGKGGQMGDRIFTGKYADWSTAAPYSSGYDSNLIIEKCTNSLMKVKNGEAVYERDSVIFDKIQYNWSLLAVLQKAAIESKSMLVVLDFGGSLGSTYFQNREFLSGLKSNIWCIIEQSHFVDVGKRYFENEQLKFFYNVEECVEKYKPTVVLLSSVLQYLEDPYYWINKFVKLKVPYIIIDRTAFVGEKDDYISIQNVPLYNARLAHWFFSKDKLDKKIQSEYMVDVSDQSYIQFNSENSRSLFLVYKYKT